MNIFSYILIITFTVNAHSQETLDLFTDNRDSAKPGVLCLDDEIVSPTKRSYSLYMTTSIIDDVIIQNTYVVRNGSMSSILNLKGSSEIYNHIYTHLIGLGKSADRAYYALVQYMFGYSMVNITKGNDEQLIQNLRSLPPKKLTIENAKNILVHREQLKKKFTHTYYHGNGYLIGASFNFDQGRDAEYVSYEVMMLKNE